MRNQAKSLSMMAATAISAITFTFLHLTLASPAQAMKIQEVTSPAGIKAWLVEEHGVPLIAMRFAFAGGASQDQPGKPGTSHFLTAMMDEGAGDMRAAAFQERVEELAVRMSFDTGRDHFTGSFQTLTENREGAVELLRLAVNAPRFDADAVERMRRQLSAGLAIDLKKPSEIAQREWYRFAFDGHPYSRPVEGTLESLATISAEDLRAYHQRIFARENLHIAVVGDIGAEELGEMLDKVFGELPAKSGAEEIAATAPRGGPLQKVIEMNVPQSVANFGHGGIPRKDDDYIPAYILNYILGGGGFSSRLTEEVREKRGLAYSVYSYVYPYERSSIYFGGVATKNESIGESLRVIRSELERMAADGPTDTELEDAKKYLTGSYALRFDTSSKIASQLLWIQIEELGIDYVDRRNDLIEAIGVDDIRRVAKRLLQPGELIVTIVGKPDNLDGTDG